MCRSGISEASENCAFRMYCWGCLRTLLLLWTVLCFGEATLTRFNRCVINLPLYGLHLRFCCDRVDLFCMVSRFVACNEGGVLRRERWFLEEVGGCCAWMRRLWFPTLCANGLIFFTHGFSVFNISGVVDYTRSTKPSCVVVSQCC